MKISNFLHENQGNISTTVLDNFTDQEGALNVMINADEVVFNKVLRDETEINISMQMSTLEQILPILNAAFYGDVEVVQHSIGEEKSEAEEIDPLNV